MSAEVYDSFAEIGEGNWDSFVGDNSIYLSSGYMRSICESNNGLSYRFVCFYKDEKLVGVSTFQICDMEATGLSRSIREKLPFLSQFIKSIKKSDDDIIRLRLLICGNAFSTGEHGFRFLEEINPEDQWKVISLAAEEIKKREAKKKNKISACFIKDFSPNSSVFGELIKGEKYLGMPGDPCMSMPMNEAWLTFDDYLQSLTSKFRTKAKGAYKKSKSLTVRDIDVEFLDNNQDRFYELYDQVYQKAEFRVGKLNFNSFRNLRMYLGEEFILKGYFLDDTLVGFRSAFVYDSVVDAHFIGIDYSLNQEHSIYMRFLYDYIEDAINSEKAKVLNYGRTAMEIKSTVGAFPVQMMTYVKHRSQTTNHLLGHLFKSLKKEDYQLRNPYKKMALQQAQ